MAREAQPFGNPLFSALLLAMHRRPGLAEDLENLSAMLSGVATSVKGVQASLEVFHNTVAKAVGGKSVSPPPAPPAPPPSPDSTEEPGDSLKESVKNLENLFARMKNNPENP